MNGISSGSLCIIIIYCRVAAGGGWGRINWCFTNPRTCWASSICCRGILWYSKDYSVLPVPPSGGAPSSSVACHANKRKMLMAFDWGSDFRSRALSLNDAPPDGGGGSAVKFFYSPPLICIDNNKREEPPNKA